MYKVIFLIGIFALLFMLWLGQVRAVELQPKAGLMSVPEASQAKPKKKVHHKLPTKAKVPHES